MGLVPILMVLGALPPHSAVFIKGHSEAAQRTRQSIASLTCYSSGADLESSAAILEVDHLVGRSGRSWIVMVLTDRRNRVLYRGKVEESPWPLPSSSARLLRDMAKSTCGGYGTLRRERNPPARPVVFKSTQD